MTLVQEGRTTNLWRHQVFADGIATTSTCGLVVSGLLAGLACEQAVLRVDRSGFAGAAMRMLLIWFSGVGAAVVARALSSRPILVLSSSVGLLLFAGAEIGRSWGFSLTDREVWLPLLVAAVGTIRRVSRVRKLGKLRALKRRVGPAIVVSVVGCLSIVPADAWIAGARRKVPTRAQLFGNGVDLSIDTHQWFASQAMLILRNDGYDQISDFFATADLSAPPARDHRTGAPLDHPESFAWRLMLGARDADGVLYPHVRDHFHNYWTHGGRRWVTGSSAAANAQISFERAVELWKRGDRSLAVYWLGAAVHLLDDACVPQHQFFLVNFFHHDFEAWVLANQDGLAVSSGAILRQTFRTNDAHGGEGWESTFPRGWVDECAHRAMHNLRAASNPLPRVLTSSDKQWKTSRHVAETQRLTAGFMVLFFEQVGFPIVRSVS